MLEMVRRAGVIGWLLAASALASATSTAAAKPAKHRPKKPRITQDADWGKSPAVRFAGLSKAECLRELRAKRVAFAEVESAPGVLAPIRLDGGHLNGVTYRTDAPAETRATSPHEVFDCRLALALFELSDVVKAHGFTEVRMFSAWRPPPRSWKSDKLATRHPGALAIDVRAFVRPATDEAPELEIPVLGTWAPAHGVAPCKKEPAAKAEGKTRTRAETLRAIYCDAAEKRLFTTQLGPNYDRAHHNHFHLEVTPGVSWRLLL